MAHAAAHQFPAAAEVVGVVGRGGDHVAAAVVEGQADRAGIRWSLVGGTNPPAEDQDLVAGVDLGGRESRRREADGLIERDHGVGAGKEVVVALPGRRVGALRAAAGRSGPTGQARLEAGIGQQVLEARRQRLVGDGIGRIDRSGCCCAVRQRGRSTWKSSTGRPAKRGRSSVGLSTVVPSECRSNWATSSCQSRMSVKSMSQWTSLPAPAGVQVVVIAEVAVLAVVGHVDVVARFGPEDVVQQLGRARPCR